ncbi:MAG: FecR domain-containing protein [Phycisphaeraceae bacterium]
MSLELETKRQLVSALSALVDGTLGADQGAWLNRVLLEEDEARRFYWQYIGLVTDLRQAAARLPAALSDDDRRSHADPEKIAALRAMESIARFERGIPLTMPEHGRQGKLWALGRRVHKVLTARGIAAVLLIGVGFLIAMALLLGREPKPPAPVAVLSESQDAAWEDDRGKLIFIRDGAALPPGRVNLTGGLAKFTFNDGAVVLLDARQRLTRFELRSPREAFLQLGKLTARADTATAKGFTVSIPGNVRVVDVSTEFGIVIDEDGTGEVHVMEGLVHAVRTDDDGNAIEKSELDVNKSIRVAPRNAFTPLTEATAPQAFVAIEEFDASQLQKSTATSVAAGAPGVQGAARMIADASTLRTTPIQSDTKINVIAGGKGVTLPDHLSVALVRPRSVSAEGSELAGAAQRLEPGTRVDSFLLVGAPRDGPPGSNEAIEYEFTITFDRPIVALIVTRDDARTAAPQPFNASVTPFKGKWQNIGVGRGDHIRISPDGRTLTVTLEVVRGWLNYLCVVTEAEPAQP